MDHEVFETNPRDYAFEILDEGLVSEETMVNLCLGWMSWDDIRKMLEEAELAPDDFDPTPEY